MARAPDGRPPSAAAAEEELRRWTSEDVDLADDVADAISFDETTLIRQEGGSTDYSMVNLPPVEAATSVEADGSSTDGGPDPPDRRWPLVVAVLVALGFMAAVLLLVGLAAVLL
ncbi:MAG: hypothetical protein U0736_04410 [Gemmataceae bacterium]